MESRNDIHYLDLTTQISKISLPFSLKNTVEKLYDAVKVISPDTEFPQVPGLLEE
jgi:hypothetical protein